MPITPSTTKAILGLDVGDIRVGVARASIVARLPEPLTTLQRGDGFIDSLQKIIKDQQAGVLVVGLPRGLDGQATAQTKATEQLVDELRQHINLPLYLQDEALTSRKAETELESRGGQHQRGDVDALAATYILEDFLSEHPSPEAMESIQ